MTVNGILDLDAIRASRAACANIPWSCPCVSGEQLDALVAELERLRAERSLLEQEARIRRRLCNRFADEVEQLRDANAKTQAWWAGQVQAERAYVVDYLSTLAIDSDTIDIERALLEAAQDIQKGEHTPKVDEEEHDPSDAWRFCEGCGCRKQTARARSWSDHSWCDDCTSRE